MTKFLLLLILSFHVHSATKLELEFSVPKVNQGAITKAKLQIPAESLQLIELQKLKGQTLQDTLYLFEVSPAMGSVERSRYESEVSLVFAKVPEKNELSFSLQGQEIVLSWKDLEVVPVEVPENLLFGLLLTLLHL